MAASYLQQGVDYTAPLDTSTLIVEVSSSAFCFRNKIKPASVKILWDKLSEYIVTMLKQQKGVLLPNLGNFRIGPVVGETGKKIRPCFQLLEGRYGQVSQERARYIVGGKSPIVQPNYGLLSTQAAIHRGATQRLVSELLQRLGVHILSNRPVKCDFPGLGRMVTNRAGRFEFVFEPLIMEWFEREHYALIREMEPGPGDQHVLKALQHVNLDDPPYIRSPASRPSSGVRPRSGVRPQSGASAVTGRSKLAGNQHAPYQGELQELFRLCKASDRVGGGTIPRLVLEGFLHQEVRGLLSQVDAATMLDLLAAHSYGKTAKMVLYRPLLDALERTLTPPSPRAVSPSPRGSNAGFEDAYGGQDVADVSFHQMPEQHRQQDEEEEELYQQHQMQYQQHMQQQQPPPQQQQYQQHMQQQQQQHMQQRQQPQTPLLQQYQQRQQQQQEMPQSPMNPAGMPPARNVWVDVAPSEPEPQDYLHYGQQQQLSPRSRADYDNFNKMHFDRLYQARGPAAKRAITPKVGEEPLNRQEYQAVRHATPSRRNTPAPTPQLYHNQGHGVAQALSDPPQRPAPAVPGLPQRVPQAWSVASPNFSAAASPLPKHLMSPRGGFQGYQHSSQVLEIMHDPVPYSQAPSPTAPSQGRAPPPQGISQYDIMNAEGQQRGRLKAEYAQNLQQGWQRQIQERQEIEKQVVQAEAQWPFQPTGMPNDKRPASGMSRPMASPRRPQSGSPYH